MVEANDSIITRITFLLFSLLYMDYSLVACTHCERNILLTSTAGKLRGSTMATRLGKEIYSFRGIRYAEPPVGERRFKEPVLIKNWEGVYDASKEGPACPQAVGVNLSEDCLTLNIYTRNLNGDEFDGDKKFPVIVFIHPGGFHQFSSQSFLYGPRYLLDQEIVLVTINHRLATLGFINTGDEKAPGNLAFKDQVMALRFVKNHIASFGGDPNLVTLSGDSSGARSIHLHLISPMSRHLFHRAILMSGSMTTPIRAQREQEGLVVRQAAALNCSTDSMNEIFSCLMEKPAEAFGKSEFSFYEWTNNPSIIWYPSIETEIPGVERFLHDDIEDLMQSSEIANVPLMVSVTRDEFSFRTMRPDDEARAGNDSLFQDLNKRWDELAPICFQYERDTNRSRFISQELKTFYFNNEPVNLRNSEKLRKLYAHSLVHFPTYRALNLIAEQSSSPIYFYEFTYKGRYSYYTSAGSNTPIPGVPHSDDLQYLFNIENPVYYKSTGFPIFEEDDPEFLTMSRLTTMWAHFARTGEPWQAGSELFQNVTWQRYTPDAKDYLDFGENLIIKNNFLDDTMNFWSGLFP